MLVEGESITAIAPANANVPDASEILDCTGCTVVAGFWNSHVHFFERKWAAAKDIPGDELAQQLTEFTRYGFTTVFDLSSSWANTRALQERIESHGVDGPRILTTGEGLIPPGGLPPKDVLRLLGTMETPMPEIADAAGARRAARAALDKGVDALKFFASSQTGDRIKIDAMRAIVEEAHAQNKPVFAHVNSARDVVAVLEAGGDIVAHTTPSSVWDDALIEAMRGRDVAVTPTLALWEFFMRHDRLSVRRDLTAAAVEQLARWRAAGGAVLFGTDYGAVSADPSREYALMDEAGMAFCEILDALTTAPARRFAARDDTIRYGRVAEGFAADIAVLEGDPFTHLSALAQVRYTVRRGEIVYRG